MTEKDREYITTFITDRIIESKFEILHQLNEINNKLQEVLLLLED